MSGSLFPPFLASDARPGNVVSFTPDTGQTFEANSLVFMYATDAPKITVCGADPAIILGMALSPAVPSAGISFSPDLKIPVLVIEPDMLFGFSSTSTPAETDILCGGSTPFGFGLAKDATTGYWQLDHSDTTAKRLIVMKVDIANGIFFCRFVPTYLQAFNGL
jgi:hypothetical protein